MVAICRLVVARVAFGQAVLVQVAALVVLAQVALAQVETSLCVVASHVLPSLLKPNSPILLCRIGNSPLVTDQRSNLPNLRASIGSIASSGTPRSSPLRLEEKETLAQVCKVGSSHWLMR